MIYLSSLIWVNVIKSYILEEDRVHDKNNQIDYGSFYIRYEILLNNT